MGLLNTIKHCFEALIRRVIHDTSNQQLSKLSEVTISFQVLPRNLEELMTLKEATLESPHAVAALCVVALCRYADDKGSTWEMLNYLKGPSKLSDKEKEFIEERLRDKTYKPWSFLAGATPDNDYTPEQPYSITITQTPYSYVNDTYVILYSTSNGADTPRPIGLRKKPSTGQWFISEISFLSDIRPPKSHDSWA